MCTTCGRQVQAASVSRKGHTRITPASFHYSPLQAQGYWTSDVFRRPGVQSRAEAREAHSAPADERTAGARITTTYYFKLRLLTTGDFPTSDWSSASATFAFTHPGAAPRTPGGAMQGHLGLSRGEPDRADAVGRDSMTLSIGNSANDIETCSGYHMMAACTFDAVRSKNPQLHSRTSTQRWHTARLESGSSRQTYFEFGQRHAASPNTHAHPASRKFWINILITAGEAARG
ncbi:hypothetical protein C8J57DRAFT_1475796, partial [Mycena rebaudengoi]